jgi:hypothetical protein
LPNRHHTQNHRLYLTHPLIFLSLCPLDIFFFFFTSTRSSRPLGFLFPFLLSLLRATYTFISMARTKQATPLRREPSSEFFSKNEGNGTPTRSPRNLDKEKGSSNGHANGSLAEKAPEAKEAGALQLVFAVGGIYGSL